MAIQVRRGNYSELQKGSLLPGEFAVTLDTSAVYMCFAAGTVYRLATYESFEADLEQIDEYVELCAEYAEDCENYKENAKTYQSNAYTYYRYSKSYAIGQGGLVGEATNNSKYYCEQSKNYSELAKSFTPEGYQELAEKVNNLQYMTDSETRQIFNFTSN